MTVNSEFQYVQAAAVSSQLRRVGDALGRLLEEMRS